MYELYEREKRESSSSSWVHMKKMVHHQAYHVGSFVLSSVLVLMMLGKLTSVMIVNHPPVRQYEVVTELLSMQGSVMPVIWKMKGHEQLTVREYSRQCLKFVLDRSDMIYSLLDIVKVLSDEVNVKFTDWMSRRILILKFLRHMMVIRYI